MSVAMNERKMTMRVIAREETGRGAEKLLIQIALLAAGREAYSELKNLCVWVKDNGGMGSLYRSQHELVFVFKHGRSGHRNNVQLGQYGRNRSNVWRYAGANSLARGGQEGNLLALHPTVKPVAMIADAILDCSARAILCSTPSSAAARH